MARKPRIHYTGAVYHVMMRGNGGQDIFFDSKDFFIFEQLIAEGIDRFKHQIHGYCWMPNHVHMVIEVAHMPLSKIVQNLSFRYTRWINMRKNRRGHLFQGRYKAILIDAENYLLELIRYVHLNPVRSNLVNSPADYKWSAHPVYLGKMKNNWVTTDWVLRRFDRKKNQARNKYQQFVLRGLNEDYRKEFHSGSKGGAVLGDDQFILKLPDFGSSKQLQVQSKLTVSDISKKVCTFYQIKESQLMSHHRSPLASKLRSIVTFIFTEQSGTSISQAADYFDKDLSTLSRRLTYLKQQILTDPTLQEEVATIKKHLNANMQA